MMFRAIQLEQDDSKKTIASIRTLPEAAFPLITDGGVTVDIEYSTINFKDCLAITGRSPVVRQWPMIPGIDFAGTVSASEDMRWRAGDKVILNGWGVGETHWGGLAQKARVKGDWLTRLPAGLSTLDAMAIGTAGYTAMLSVMALERHGVHPDGGEVLVTGATGGVGSFAVALLAKAGFTVVASTGKLAEADYLHSLGATEIMDRALLSQAGRPLQKERWRGAIDSVGSHTLANVCATTRYGGTVTACGLAQGMDFPTSVAPFILRGITLAGIDSVMAPSKLRGQAWTRLAAHLDAGTLRRISSEVGLTSVIGLAEQLLAGEKKGRIIVDVNR